MNFVFERVGNAIFCWLFNSANNRKVKVYKKKFHIDPTALLNYPENTWLKGNISIGPHTYINSGRFISGDHSSIKIGEWCAIGHNVSVIAWTHSVDHPTGPIEARPTIEKDIIIGNHVWIGSNVFIREGVTIGDHAVIAANSVVIKDIPEKAIVGGVPASIIRIKEK